MDLILKEINTFLASDPPLKKQPSYLEMKNASLPVKIGFSSIPEHHGPLPTFLLEPYNSNESPNVFSRSVGVKHSLKDLAEVEKKDPYSEICNHIMDSSIKQISLDLLENKGKQLQIIENELTEIVEGGRVDIRAFSQNCLTNLTTYDIDGNPVEITNILVDRQSKKYGEYENEEMLISDKLPHPIRSKKKIRKKQEIIKKSQREVMEEFNILSGMFDEETLKSKKQQNYQQIMDAVSLNDGNSYQQLWEKIVGQIKVNKEKATSKKTDITKEMGDQQFQKAIDRIMQEAIEYEKQAFDIESEQQNQEEQEKKQQMVEMEEKKEEKPEEKSNFQTAKIQKNVKVTSNSKYQFAVEDQSDLADFYDHLPKEKFATSYAFELDDFQKRSILHLQKKQSVFVAAHTSAGKTVVAEYGIALAINHKRKVIYTSPIKALSNQKYRQLSKKFPGSVGIVTGDVSLNQQANCVIMTTQILRNNLYRGAEMIRDIEWVIFDEVHYINNQERGVVWEETIIMLPEHIGIIMLSATVPNYMDFANWVGRTKRRTIYVMKTLHRPVPLEHSLFIFNKFHVIKQPNGKFLKEEYNELRHEIDMVSTNAEVKNKALKQEKKKKIEERGFYNDSRREQRIKLMNKTAVDKFVKKITRADIETTDGREEHRLLEELIADCKKKKLLPCVIFTFSKRKINSLASKVYYNDLTDRSEKSKIARMFAHAFSNLKPEDRDIEQFNFLQEICFNGYAVHHGDLLPLAKEIVELLFSQGLIKVLFATETFAMGINMPTKTVIFNSVKKVTGSQGLLRFLNSSEYVQMSGRAGRRGLDEKGTVIIVVKNPGNLPQGSEMQKMIDHPGERLESKFRVTYTIILNLLNSKDFGVTEMLRQSFLQNPKFSQFSSNVKSLKHYKGEYQRIIDEFQCPYNKLGTRILIDEYMNISKDLRKENQQFFYNYKKSLGQPKFAKVLGNNNEIGICLILRVDYEKRHDENSRYIQVMIVNEIFLGMELTKEERQIEEKKMGLKKKIVLEYDEDRKKNERFSTGEVLGTNNRFHYYVYWVSPSMIIEVFGNKLKSKYLFDDSKQSYRELSQQLLNVPKQLNSIQGLGDSSNKQILLKQMETFDCHQCQFKDIHQNEHGKRQKLKGKLSSCAKKIDTNELGMMGSFEGMLNLLVKFKFINQTKEEEGNQYSTLTLKGRVAKEVDIYVAQIIVQAVLDDLDPAQIAGLLSAFVCDYKPRPGRGEEEKPITPFDENQAYTMNLSKAIDETYSIIRKIVEQEEASEAYLNLTTDSMDEYILTLINFHLSETVYKWAVGFDFNEAASDTKAPEGTVVRTILRLNQLLSNVKSVCRIIGNHELEGKVNTAIECIKRDIVFCQSLYLTG